MDNNSWLWIALIVFLVFCCLPMLFMGKSRRHPDVAAKANERENKLEPPSDLGEQYKEEQPDERT